MSDIGPTGLRGFLGDVLMLLGGIVAAWAGAALLLGGLVQLFEYLLLTVVPFLMQFTGTTLLAATFAVGLGSIAAGWGVKHL